MPSFTPDPPKGGLKSELNKNRDTKFYKYRNLKSPLGDLGVKKGASY
jgi:hypothetical protein